MEMVRVVTAGSVDNGKSTLIGRLLMDMGSLHSDQVIDLQAASRSRGTDFTDLSLVTDGLRSERERGVTIDVAYRHLVSGKRIYLLADTPGHKEYLRNTVTGASTADVGVILVEVSSEITAVAVRHAWVMSLLGVKQIVILINKMDEVDYLRSAYENHVRKLSAKLGKFSFEEVTYIPISALHGEGITAPSDKMPWYSGPSLISTLAKISPRDTSNLPFRMRIQSVGLAQGNAKNLLVKGTIADGIAHTGQTLLALPHGQIGQVQVIHAPQPDPSETTRPVNSPEGPQISYLRERAYAGEAVALEIQPRPTKQTSAENQDSISSLSRGDLLCDPNNPAHIGQQLSATLVWMHDSPLQIGADVHLSLEGNLVAARITSLRNAHRNMFNVVAEATELEINEMAEVNLEVIQPIAWDNYAQHQCSGSFTVLEPARKLTAGGGMFLPIPPGN